MASQIYQVDGQLLIKLDEEISVLVRRLAELRARRNTLVPISRIPNEILSRVFSNILYRDNSEAILPLSHVCGFWRAVALETRGLWVKPKLDKVELGRMILERAGSLPLVVTINDEIFTENVFAFVEAFAAEAVPRARELRITTEDGYDEALDTLRSWLATGASDLVYLDVTHIWPSDDSDVAPIFPGFDLFPALKVLRVSAWAIGDCRVHRLPNLTTLEINGDDNFLPYYPISHLCEMLQEMKALQSLILRHAMEYNHEPDSWNGLIALPHLHRLGLKDSVRTCLQLLKILHYPADTLISVSCSPSIADPSHPEYLVQITRDDGILFPEIVAVLRRNWTASDSAEYHEMCISLSFLLLRLYNPDVCHPLNYDECTPVLRIEYALHFRTHANIIRVAASKVLPALNSQINTLVLHIDHEYNALPCLNLINNDIVQQLSALFSASGCGDSLVVYGCRLDLLCSVLDADHSLLCGTNGPSHVRLVNPRTPADWYMRGLHAWLERRLVGTGRPLETLDFQVYTLPDTPMLETLWHGLAQNVTIACNENFSRRIICGWPLPYYKDERRLA